jgi:hypothetical protein
MNNETVHDPVYQYRWFDRSPNTTTSGTWSKWENISHLKYKTIEGYIANGVFYQVRVLSVVASFPTDDYIAEHYKVRT